MLDDPDVLAGLQFVTLEPRHGAKGQVLKSQGARFRLPAQQVSTDLEQDGAQVLFGIPEGPTVYTSVSELDEAKGEVVLVWNDAAMELDVFPAAVAHHD